MTPRGVQINTTLSGAVIPGLLAVVIYVVIAFVTGASAVAAIVGGLVVAAIAITIGLIFRTVFKRRGRVPLCVAVCTGDATGDLDERQVLRVRRCRPDRISTPEILARAHPRRLAVAARVRGNDEQDPRRGKGDARHDRPAGGEPESRDLRGSKPDPGEQDQEVPHVRHAYPGVVREREDVHPPIVPPARRTDHLRRLRTSATSRRALATRRPLAERLAATI